MGGHEDDGGPEHEVEHAIDHELILDQSWINFEGALLAIQLVVPVDSLRQDNLDQIAQMNGGVQRMEANMDMKVNFINVLIRAIWAFCRNQQMEKNSSTTPMAKRPMHVYAQQLSRMYRQQKQLPPNICFPYLQSFCYNVYWLTPTASLLCNGNINIQYRPMMHLSTRLSRPFSSLSQLLTKSKPHKFNLGQYPKALEYSRPFQLTRLPNNIRVASEVMQSNLASISVFINCGSRNETPQTSGTAHFLEHLHFKGTKNRTREELEIGVENIGGNLNAYTSRENTSYMMTVFKDDLDKAVEIVGDMITNSLYEKKNVDNERSTIKRELRETQKSNPMETTIEISHRGIYGDHVMALPILGSEYNMETISKEMIEQYHNQNYVGENIILVASGPINHNHLIQLVQKYIKVPAKAATPAPPITKPKFHPGLSSLYSNLTQKVNMTVSYEAPSFFDHEFFSYLLLQRIVSDRPETELELQILKNCPAFKFQQHLAPYDFILKQKGFYTAYWDTGIFGNYFVCQPEKAKEVIELSIQGFAKYASSVTDQEIERAKRRVFIEILQHDTQNDLTQSVANNIMYYDRRVTNKEIAERVAVVGAKEIQQLCKRLVDPNKINVCIWGNTEKVPFLDNKNKKKK